MQFEEAKDWRQLLGMIIQDTRIRQRIIGELGIKAITLHRWVNGGIDPRPQNFKQLLNTLPEYREQFIDLLGDEYDETLASTLDDASKVIPSSFFATVLSTRSNTRKELRFWSLAILIFQHAIGQLDPDRLGMAITVVRCMKSSRSQKIRSLRETVAFGTLPWEGNLEQKGMFLGAESLAGYCVTTCRGVENNDIRDKNNPLPAHQIEDELSAAAYPILFSGKIAGSMLVSSTQRNYFLSQYRLTLIHHYANLLALSLEPEDFYELNEIQLQMMPPLSIQKQYFGDFRSRVTKILTQKSMAHTDAEQEVWEELEEELLEVQKKGALAATS